MKSLVFFEFIGNAGKPELTDLNMFKSVKETGGHESSGFTSVEEIEGGLHIKFSAESRKVPKSAIDEEVDKWILSSHIKPSKKEIKEKREDIENALLPRAFPKKSEFDVFICTKTNRLFICTVSQKAIDVITSAIIWLFEGAEIKPIESNCKDSLNNWLFEQQAPDGFSLGDSVILNGGGGMVSYKKHAICIDEIQNHITSSKNCERLNMSIGDLVDFDITNELTFPKIKFRSLQKSENQEELLESKSTLMIMELREFAKAIEGALK